MSEAALVLRNDAVRTFDYTSAAIAIKESALAAGALIGRVSSAEEQAAAVEAQREVSRVIKLGEQARKAAKEPVIDFGRQIDDKARLFVRELKEEEVRLAALVGDFQKLEEARVRAAEQLRLAEERKLQEERRRAEQQALREAELAKQKLDAEQAMINRKVQEARNAEEKTRLQAEALQLERLRKQAEVQTHEELDRINEQHCQQVAALPVAQAARAEGQRVQSVWEVTVTDIWLLAKAHPTCVKIEPRLSEIKGLLDAGVKVAGVLAKREIKAGVSSTRERQAIEI